MVFPQIIYYRYTTLSIRVPWLQNITYHGQHLDILDVRYLDVGHGPIYSSSMCALVAYHSYIIETNELLNLLVSVIVVIQPETYYYLYITVSSFTTFALRVRLLVAEYDLTTQQQLQSIRAEKFNVTFYYILIGSFYFRGILFDKLTDWGQEF